MPAGATGVQGPDSTGSPGGPGAVIGRAGDADQSEVASLREGGADADSCRPPSSQPPSYRWQTMTGRDMDAANLQSLQTDAIPSKHETFV